MIDFKNVEISYGNFTAVKDLNLTIKEGEFFTFLGPSGCGKTTTLRALAGFNIPSGGQIFIDNKEVTKEPVEKRKVGMVFQSYALFPTMTVYENISFGLNVQKVEKVEIKRRVQAVAEKIHISEEQLKRNVSELSGGQQQRIALARAIIQEPKILCLDEPLSNLDAKLRVGLRGELKRLQRDLNITTLYVTHDQEEAMNLSDRIAVFNNGFIEQVGTPYDIYNHSASEFVCDFIGDINRLEKDAVSLIKSQTGCGLNPEITGFVRIERLLSTPKDGYARLKGRVTELEYNGMIAKYTVSIGNQTVKCVEKNDGREFLKPGQEMELFVNPADIMQFS
ncbi:ABC transporter ATP-binding protein [Lacrimispora brassicae]